MNVIPKPNKNEVIKYLNLWDSLENYVLQESSLDKLLLKTYPENRDINDILNDTCLIPLTNDISKIA